MSIEEFSNSDTLNFLKTNSGSSLVNENYKTSYLTSLSETSDKELISLLKSPLLERTNNFPEKENKLIVDQQKILAVNNIHNLNYLYKIKQAKTKVYFSLGLKSRKFKNRKLSIQKQSALFKLKVHMVDLTKKKRKHFECIFPTCNKAYATYYKWHTHHRTHVIKHIFLLKLIIFTLIKFLIFYHF